MATSFGTHPCPTFCLQHFSSFNDEWISPKHDSSHVLHVRPVESDHEAHPFPSLESTDDNEQVSSPQDVDQFIANLEAGIVKVVDCTLLTFCSRTT
jgi:hypothetical protein